MTVKIVNYGKVSDAVTIPRTYSQYAQDAAPLPALSAPQIAIIYFK